MCRKKTFGVPELSTAQRGKMLTLLRSFVYKGG